MDKKITKSAIKNFKEHPIESILLGILLALIIIIPILVGLYSRFFALILMPFLVIPAIYATLMMHLSLQYEQGLRLSNLARYFKLYFKRPNNGAFELVGNVFKSVLVYFVLSAIISIGAYMAFMLINQETFTEVFHAISGYLQGEDIGSILNALTAEQIKLLYTIACISTVPGVIFTNLYFFYKFTFNFISPYFRLSFPKADPNFLRAVYSYTVKNNKKELNKDYFKLSWPFFVLYIVGSIIGVVVTLVLKYETYSQTFDVVSICYISSLFAIVACVFYFTFIFSNMEVIFEKYEDNFVTSSNDVTMMYLNKIQNKIDLSQEEQEKLKELLSKFNNPLNDDNSETEETNENNDKTD